jgi:hypothetical protein
MIDVPIPEDVLKRVTEVAMATCGEERPIDVAVTHVDFADGSQWDLGEEIRKGATFVDSTPR